MYCTWFEYTTCQILEWYHNRMCLVSTFGRKMWICRNRCHNEPLPVLPGNELNNQSSPIAKDNGCENHKWQSLYLLVLPSMCNKCMTLSVLETSLPMQRSHDTLASSIWAKNWCAKRNRYNWLQRHKGPQDSNSDSLLDMEIKYQWVMKCCLMSIVKWLL